LTVIVLLDASKNTITVGLPTVEDLKHIFTDVADKNVMVETTLRFIVDINIVTDIDISCIMFVFDWFIVNIIDPNFDWGKFT
jgi:hypothetical protein